MGPIVRVDPTDSTPIYVQIADGVKAHIASGRLRAGDALPSLRDLAQDLGVNLNTVKAAYELLERAELIYLRRGRRAVVRPPAPRSQEKDALRARLERLYVEARLAGLDQQSFLRLCQDVSREGAK